MNMIDSEGEEDTNDIIDVTNLPESKFVKTELKNLEAKKVKSVSPGHNRRISHGELSMLLILSY